MKCLVVGKGGREHALVRELAKSKRISEVHAIPGSHGMKSMAQVHTNLTSDNETLKKFVSEYNIDLIVVGPEAEIANGLADEIRSLGKAVFAPDKQASQLESSKVFSKQFMNDNGIPTAVSEVVTSVSQTLESSDNFTPPFVLKVDGLAAGKGVYICKDKVELETAAKEIFDDKKFAAAGSHCLLEQFEQGWEVSYLVITDGKDYRPLPLSQDHKRLSDGDRGPNTGGMGVVGPIHLPIELEEKIQTEILEPSIAGIKNQGWNYRGILYVGIMVTESGPKVLEYNVRFGDPEAQVVLPLLDGDWGEVFYQTAQGQLPQLDWKNQSGACLVLAAPGYPESPEKGLAIKGELSQQDNSNYFIHAGTHLSESGEWVTNGGRVLNVLGFGKDIKQALKQAYALSEKVSWPGLQKRTDIGSKVLK